ncbi:MAG TPA: hypothetical protein VG738_15540 [Chitinophagaceae bacterium]|nr:hypothetical protein [Chitinophagaceae bacterium]
MKKCFSIAALLTLLSVAGAHAQYGGTRIYVQPGYARPYQQPRRIVRGDNFQPTLNFSIGYGFPNLDKNEFAEFSNAYKGTYSQNGPVTGAVDFQFSRYMSAGVMGTYGKVTMPYYDYNSQSTTPAFTGKLENWSIMFNLVNYFPSYNKGFSPYLRTAAGVNNWTQSYTDGDGKKVADVPDPNLFSYQVSLGARINLSPNAGIYMEAGYGKYILNGGLTVRL